MSPTVLNGTSGNDTLATSDDIDRVRGFAGDDTLILTEYGGGAFGGPGHDTLIGGGRGAAQSHMYGGAGDDVLVLSAADSSAPYGEHVWGGEGRDQFHFDDVTGGAQRITGRLDDFDSSRDEIWLDGERIDLTHPPANVRIVEYNGQPWILIDDRVLYALEGARILEGDVGDLYEEGYQSMGRNLGEEKHFIEWPREWANGVPASADISYEDYVAYFPADKVTVNERSLNQLRGTESDDSIFGSDQGDRILGYDGSDVVYGYGGGDLIQGGEGKDTLDGGEGNDSLSGGLDRDLLYGDAGNDVLYGGSGYDTLYGGTGRDTLYGNNGNDLIHGDAGGDVLYGGRGDDTLYGGQGHDVLYAQFEPGQDHVSSHEENDLYGGAGDDTLYAAQDGYTAMTGGAGADVLHANSGGEVVLADFMPGEDQVDLTGVVPAGTDLSRLMILKDRADGMGAVDLMLVMPAGASVLFQGLGPADMEAVLGSIHVGDSDAPEVPDDFDPNNPDGEDDNPDDDRDNEDEEKDGGSDGSCFVATACYGDGGHPDVVWLRALRDRRLVNSRAGRAFIATYWKVGPVLAKGVDHRRRSGRVMRSVLHAFVRFGQRNIRL